MRQNIVSLLEGIVEKHLEYVDVYDHCVQSQNEIFTNGNVIVGTALLLLKTSDFNIDVWFCCNSKAACAMHRVKLVE